MTYLKRIYTGIGSRETPADVLEKMTEIAQTLSVQSFVLRSGGADGADKAFEDGALKKEIYLPWPGFNGNQSRLSVISEKAKKIAAEHHPAWNKLKESIQKLHARNTYQILGYDLVLPSDFVLCWTPDGCESQKTRTFKTGGTGTAISLASSFNIPVFNLKNQDAYQRLKKFLKDHEISL